MFGYIIIYINNSYLLYDIYLYVYIYIHIIKIYRYINISPHIGFTEALKKLVAFSPSSPPASFVRSSRDRFGSDEWDPVRISTWIAICF